MLVRLVLELQPLVFHSIRCNQLLEDVRVSFDPRVPQHRFRREVIRFAGAESYQARRGGAAIDPTCRERLLLTGPSAIISARVHRFRNAFETTPPAHLGLWLGLPGFGFRLQRRRRRCWRQRRRDISFGGADYLSDGVVPTRLGDGQSSFAGLCSTNEAQRSQRPNSRASTATRAASRSRALPFGNGIRPSGGTGGTRPAA